MIGKIIKAFRYFLTHSFSENCELLSWKTYMLVRKINGLFRNVKKRCKTFLRKTKNRCKTFLRKTKNRGKTFLRKTKNRGKALFKKINKQIDKIRYRYNKWRSLIPLPIKRVQYSKKPFGTPCAVSVVIPVYNAQDYLADCLDSVFSQTLKDFEVICVDDGSQDNSLRILKEYEKNHQNMKVLTQKNQFAGVARNNGLAVANGEYVLFMDSDDLIRNDALEKTYARAKEKNADVVLFGAAVFLSGQRRAEPLKYHLNTKWLPQQDPFNRKDVPDYILNITPGCPWNKLFRKATIEKTGLRFKGFQNVDDVGFVYPFLALAEKITTINEPFYFLRRGISTNQSASRDKVPYTTLYAYEDVQNTLKQHGVYEEIKRSFINLALGGSLFGMSVIHSDTLRYDVEEKFLEDYRFRFEIADKLDRYFFLRTRYKQYCEMLERHPAHKKVVISEDDVLVSVIVPMYNCGEYVDSLMNKMAQQTIQNFEIICVDDGSTDDTREKVEAVQKQYSNVRYIHKENGGAGTARNYGLCEARGKYVIFLDADDLYNPELLEKLSDAALENDADVINCLFEQVDFWKKVTSEKLGFKKKFLPEKKCFKPSDVRCIFEAFTLGPINKLFNRAFLLEKDLTFSSTKIANDIKFIMLALIEAERIVCIDDSLLTVRRYVNDNSISSQRGKHLPHAVTAYRELYESLVSRGLINSYERHLCRSFGGTVYYNGQYAQSEDFVDAVVNWLREDPWCHFSKKELFELLGFARLDAKKQELDALKAEAENWAEDEKNVKNVQLAFAENQIANIESIQEKMKECGLL